MAEPSDDPRAAAMLAYSEHSNIIGMVALAWSGAQHSLYLMFVVLMGMRKPEADAIFFTLKADSTQREVTRSLAKATLMDNPGLLRRTAEAISAFENLAGERNAAMHTMWYASIDEAKVAPSPYARIHGALRPDHRDQFLELIDKLSDLEDALFHLAEEIRQHLASRGKAP